MAAIAVRVLAEVDWDPTIFVAFGEEATPTREYAEERLGDVYLRPAQGHDGKFFFVQSNDPWVLDPEENALVLDRPLYRSQRMLYPLLAGGGGLFGSETITWSMLVVNVLAMGAGTWVVARIAMEMGGSPWWGLAFALNLGFISEVNIGGAGVVAAVAAFGAVLAVMKGRRGLAVGLLVVAVFYGRRCSLPQPGRLSGFGSREREPSLWRLLWCRWSRLALGLLIYACGSPREALCPKSRRSASRSRALWRHSTPGRMIRSIWRPV